MSYSIDLRKRVVDFVKAGGGKSEAARRFSVGRQAVYHWLNREDLTPKPYVRTKMKLDPEAVRAYVSKHNDAYLREIGAHFSVRANTVFYALKKLKITLKKKPRGTKSAQKSCDLPFEKSYAPS